MRIPAASAQNIKTANPATKAEALEFLLRMT